MTYSVVYREMGQKIETNNQIEQARKSLLTPEQAEAQAYELLLNNWGSISTKMDSMLLLKKFNLMGFIGQPISILQANELFARLEHESDEVLEDYGW